LEVKIEKSSNDNRHSEEPNIQKGSGAGRARVEEGSETLESEFGHFCIFILGSKCGIGSSWARTGFLLILTVGSSV